MTVQKLACASCGAPIHIPVDIDKLNCAYCGASLIVQRGDGYITLKIVEQISQAIQDTGIQTQSTIREGAQITQVELRRLQMGQELSSARIQMSNLQTEIRSLERQKRNRKIGQQLKELRFQESQLIANIYSLQAALAPLISNTDKTQQQMPGSKPSSNSRFKQSCLTGFLVYCVIGVLCGFIAIPLDQAIFHKSMLTSTGSLATNGPFFIVAVLFGFFVGVLTFLYKLNPDAPMWKPVKNELRKIFPPKKGQN